MKNQTTNIRLEALGFGSHYLAREPDDGRIIGRVTARRAMRYEVATRAGILEAQVSGKLSYMALNESELPVVGDWVLGVWDLETAQNGQSNSVPLGLVLEVLPRRGILARRQVDRSDTAQVMASNVDKLLILWSLDRIDATVDIRENRTRWGGLQRFITLATAGSLTPIIIFSKADLVSLSSQKYLHQTAKDLWPGLEIFLLGGLDNETSASSDEQAAPCLHTVTQLAIHLEPASTSVLVGLSGAGKSTLANALSAALAPSDTSGTGTAFDYQIIKTGTVREDDRRGRHTTTHRELYALGNGALIIDSPGIREIGIWGDEDDINESFSDISALATSCKFSDCSHENEPGCAVQAAIRSGELAATTLIQYRKQISEVRKAEARNIRSGKVEATGREMYEAGEDKRKWMAIHKSMKNFSKENRSKRG